MFNIYKYTLGNVVKQYSRYGRRGRGYSRMSIYACRRLHVIGYGLTIGGLPGACGGDGYREVRRVSVGVGESVLWL